MSNDVSFQRPDYTAALRVWSTVDDAVNGDVLSYLPTLNEADESQMNAIRNRQYKERAVYYNATKKTIQSLVGAAFVDVPICTLPASIEYAKTDIDGNGLSVFQQSQGALEEVLKKGRYALLVDYPQVEPGTSRAQIAAGGIRATVVTYKPESVINWRLGRFGAVYKYTLVVLSEEAAEPTPDGFGEEVIAQYRVLRLAQGIYTQEVWRKIGGAWALYQEPRIVKNSAGKTWSQIPFTFVGSCNNDAHVDAAPAYDISVLNIGHYRNSADYEDSVFLCGQPQVWLSGLDEQWREHMEGTGIYVGSRAPMLLPVNGSAGILQAAPNTLCKEAMDQKEAQMISLGARLVTPGGAVKTATEAQSDNESEHSVLSLAVANVSEAYTSCLKWMAEFMGGPGEAEYIINQEFAKPELTAQMLTALAGWWDKGQWPKADMNRVMRSYGLLDAEKTDEEIDAELESNPPGLILGDE